jgi:Uma2 family endonuclease
MMRAMPRVPPFDRPATYGDLERVPDDSIAEIVDGELHATPRPSAPHVEASSSLGVLIGGPFHHGRGGPGGWWILDEPEVHPGRDVVVPDLAGWRRARMPRRPESPFFPLAPDWVCEVTSPSTASLDRVKKLTIYAREQVGHAWLIDPVARTLEVLRLEAGRWTILGAYARDENVRAEPFAEIEFGLGALWMEPERGA